MDVSMTLPINLPMDLRDLSLWESGELKGFALPLRRPSDLGLYLGLNPGTEVNILEPFRKLYVYEEAAVDGKPARRVMTGAVYRSDGKFIWANGEPPPEGYETAKRWSDACRLPEFAIRRKAVITGIESATLSSFTKEQIKLLRLDYESQGDPQLIMEDYAPDKDADLLYKWWKKHYGHTLDDSVPKAVILHIAPPEGVS